jgi:uncharacterized membrane protein
VNDIAIAVAVHVLAVVWWIGGVAMVTTVILPAARRANDPAMGLAMFQSVESRFAWHARAATVVAAVSGFYMVGRLGLWSNFLLQGHWWLDAMVFLWLIFTLVLFVAEPLLADRWLKRHAAADPARILAVLERLHWIGLALSMLTVLGAVAGTH